MITTQAQTELRRNILPEARHASRRIAPHIRRTPLDYSDSLSKEPQTSIRLKLENLQVTGSFKPRGSLNKLLKLQIANGVVASTAGNHGNGQNRRRASGEQPADDALAGARRGG